MKFSHRLARRAATYATAIAVATVGSVVFATPAQAYCKISRWHQNIYTMHVRSDVPSSWHSHVQAAIAVHEIGHANGLHHPDLCPDGMTQAEIDSAMYPNWRNKPNTNGDDRAGIDSHY